MPNRLNEKTHGHNSDDQRSPTRLVTALYKKQTQTVMIGLDQEIATREVFMPDEW